MNIFIRCLTSAVVSGLIWCGPLAADTPVLRVHFLDAGYADAILLELPGGKTAMIDAGDARHASKIVNRLKSLPVQEIDALILTHPDENHYEGLLNVLAAFPVKNFYHTGQERPELASYRSLIAAINTKKVPVKTLKRGDTLTLGGAAIRVLHPARVNGSPNENSLVLYLTFKRTSFLLTADIQPAQQKELVRSYPEISQADCVQVPHHGGEIADEFAALLQNKIFVLSTGRNEYGKPYRQELKKLTGRVLRTDRSGAIVLESDGEKISIKTERGNEPD